MSRIVLTFCKVASYAFKLGDCMEWVIHSASCDNSLSVLLTNPLTYLLGYASVTLMDGVETVNISLVFFSYRTLWQNFDSFRGFKYRLQLDMKSCFSTNI